MENQLQCKGKKKIKVDSFMVTRDKNDANKQTKIIALCLTESNLSDGKNYEDKVIDVTEFEAFLRRKSYSQTYRPETMHPLMCADLAHFINEKEGRTEDMEEPKFSQPVNYKHPVNQILGHMNDAIESYNHFSL